MYVLYSRPTRITGRELRRALSAHGGMLPHYEQQRESISLVRWGCSFGEDAALTLNRKEAVAKAANKLESLRVMKEAGIDVPRFSTNPLDFGDAIEGGDIFFGRTRSHFGGRDIQVLDGPHTTSVFSDFFTEYVPSVRELRLHIFLGKAIGAQVKVWEGEGDEDEIKIRNHDRGYVFVPYVHTWPNSSRIEAAAAAVAAHGLDFGAVDLLVTEDNRNVVLEVNTAPGLSERFFDIYRDAIVGWADNNRERTDI